MLTNDLFDQLLGYLGRRRGFQHATDQQLLNLLAASYRSWVNGKTPPKHKLLPDVLAELLVRGASPTLTAFMPR